MQAHRSSLADDLRRLGVRPGDTLMVHAGVRSVGPVIGGVNVIVQALFDSLGPDGTLVAYVDWETGVEDWNSPHVPVFDKRIARAARDHGILHEVIRTWPGAIRSNHPDAGVCAIGARAEWLCADHDPYYGYGERSPFAKVIEVQGKVLMLGAPLDRITLLHHSEHVARIPEKRVIRYRRLMPGPTGPAWITFEEFDTDNPVTPLLDGIEGYFATIAAGFLETGRGSKGQVGQATSYLFDAPALHDYAVQWLEDQHR